MSVRDDMRCKNYTYTSSSSLSMFSRMFSLVLHLNVLIFLVDFKSDARLSHMFGRGAFNSFEKAYEIFQN